MLLIYLLPYGDYKVIDNGESSIWRLQSNRYSRIVYFINSVFHKLRCIKMNEILKQLINNIKQEIHLIGRIYYSNRYSSYQFTNKYYFMQSTYYLINPSR
jgi:hypothetical protein